LADCDAVNFYLTFVVVDVSTTIFHVALAAESFAVSGSGEFPKPVATEIFTIGAGNFLKFAHPHGVATNCGRRQRRCVFSKFAFEPLPQGSQVSLQEIVA
jgi:hypothetical protein